MSKYKPVLFLLVCSFLVKAQQFSSGQAARAAIGQLSFTYVNSTPGLQVLGGPSGLAYSNGTLYVADSNHVGALPQGNRVLTFDAAQIPPPQADLTLFPAYSAVCHLCGYPAQNVLGQPNYTSTTAGVTSQALTTPTAVATDGNILAVADTDNNRVLIWSSIPTSKNAPANIVLGQANFTTGTSTSAVNAQTLRGPQGVWIQNGKLFVADTLNSRVLIWNTIPTQNNQPADLELGQPNLASANQPPVSGSNPVTAANQLSNPVSVTSDGQRLYVADLGFNRVLIWNRIPTAMDQPADVVVGQPDMTSTAANNGAALCTNPPASGICNKSLNFPRFALSDGTRLFIADGGNDRVLIFNSIPTANAAAADTVLGQPDFIHDVISSQSTSLVTNTIDNTGSVDTVPSPMSLAFDGTNLYVSDPFNRRVLVFTPGITPLPPQSVLNHASEVIRQEGTVTLAGTIVAKDTVTVTIAGKAYTYTIQSTDSLTSIAQALVNSINAGAGDPNVTALLGPVSGVIYLSSKKTNLPFDAISLVTATSSTNITATASGGYLTAGTAATVAPGTIVEINGTNLSNTTVTATFSGALPPNGLGGTEVFMDGLSVPVWMVSPTQIIAQVPYSFTDRSSSSVYVLSNGTSYTNATPISIAPANPGLFSAPTYPGQPRPWPASNALHQPYNPSTVISISGVVNAGDTATITVNGRKHSYTVKTGDVLGSISDGLIAAINSSGDPQATAGRAGPFSLLVIARQAGAAGTGIPVSSSISSGAKVVLTVYNPHTCCAVVSNSLITPSNPAVPGEIVSLSATGLGALTAPANASQIAGSPYAGPQPNSASNTVSATVNGGTAQVVYAGLPFGSYGEYQVQILVPPKAPTNVNTEVYVAQNAFISNIVTFAVGPAAATSGGQTGGGTSGTQGSHVASDFDGDGKADFSVWRPSTGTWYILPSATNVPYDQQWGLPNDVPLIGDFNGDGRTDFAVWRPTTGDWFILPAGATTGYMQQWGLPGDIPVAADFDGDGKTDLAVWRPSTGMWFIYPSATAAAYVEQWGLPGDVPLAADYDGDGKADRTVWRPSTGTWFIVPSSGTQPYSFQWGLPGDIPIAADFDGDGRADLAVWRPSTGTWFVIPTTGELPYSVQWGLPGDVPLALDFNGDKRADFVVWRPSTGMWFVMPSNGAPPFSQQWGLPGDIPN